MVHENGKSIQRPPLGIYITAETPCSIVRVKSSKIIEFLHENVDLSTRADMIRMMLIRISQLSFMISYRYVCIESYFVWW